MKSIFLRSVCPVCGGSLVEGASNEFGFQCDTCGYPTEEKEDD